VAVIAGIELPIGQWPDLIDILVNNVTSQDTTSNLKQATLQAIGYICESIVNDIVFDIKDY
jgi:importin subunit beta-1